MSNGRDIDIPAVARTQRMVLLGILAQILVLIARGVLMATQAPATGSAPTSSGAASLVLLLVALAVGVATLAFLVLLMVALKRPIVSIILAALSQFIPVVSLLVLLVVNQRATRTLREAGVHVGFLGARM
ncbi:MAG: hypothetical protein KDA22_15840 [Phycisphaerales bacterium]|nr:hypothetical protein [Phycisphaerales bacterium]